MLVLLEINREVSLNAKIEKLVQIKGVKALVDARESCKVMLDVLAKNKNMTVSLFKANEPNIKEWLTEIGSLNRKIGDLCNRAADTKESGLEQDEIEESVYSLTVSSKMHNMLIALEQINISSNPSDENLDKNSTTIEGLNMFIQAPKLQCSKFSGKNVSKFEFKNFLIQFSNGTFSI